MAERNKAVPQDRRIGRFSATEAVVNKPEFRVLMACCSVIKAEFNYATRTFEYYAISPHFDELEAGAMPPVYRWIAEHHEPLGQLTVRAEVESRERNKPKPAE